MPTGANGQDWLARGQIWLVVAIRNEAHTVSKYRGGEAGLPEEGPRDGFALSTQRRRAVGALTGHVERKDAFAVARTANHAGDASAATGEAQHDVIAHRDGVHVPPDTLDDT